MSNIYLKPRQVWFIERIKEIIKELNKLEESENWSRYLAMSHLLGEELIYCTTEWQKYYPENE